MNVETMRAFAPNQWTVIARIFTIGAAAIECIPTDAAIVIIGQPFPCGDRGPILNFDFHWNMFWAVAGGVCVETGRAVCAKR